MTVVLLVTVLSAASCGVDDIIGKFTDNEETTVASDSTDKPDDPDGPGSDIDSKKAVQDKLYEFGKTTGYEFTMNITSNGETSTYTTGFKGNVWWTYEGESGMAMVEQKDGFISLYSFDGEEWEIDSNILGQDAQSLRDIYGSALSAYLYNASNYSSTMKKVGSETVAGRSCDKYSYSDSAYTVFASYDASVDKELGITMKWHYTISAGDESGSVGMEITSFNSGSSVTVPTLPDPGEDYMDYSGVLGWPSNSYTALIPQLPGKVSMSAIQDGQFVAISSGVTAADFSAYVAALQAKGFEGELNDTIFTGTNSDGISVMTLFSDGSITVSVSKD